MHLGTEEGEQDTRALNLMSNSSLPHLICRICAGVHFAESTLWITAAQILACYDISPIIINGHKILPPIDACSGLLS